MATTQNIETLHSLIYAHRRALDLTQDEYGQRYGVSGPAIFKFEKGYVRPSFNLWLSMAKDAELTERRAVLLWLRTKLPEKYREYVELTSRTEKRPRTRKGLLDYAGLETAEEMQQVATKDTKLPKPLRNLLDDDELWRLYKPTGHEINMLRDMFSPIGRGSSSAYREALRLIREFTHSF